PPPSASTRSWTWRGRSRRSWVTRTPRCSRPGPAAHSWVPGAKGRRRWKQRDEAVAPFTSGHVLPGDHLGKQSRSERDVLRAGVVCKRRVLLKNHVAGED